MSSSFRSALPEHEAAAGSRYAEYTKEGGNQVENIKPHRNLFPPTIAQRNKHSQSIAMLPEARYYRKYLESYLNDVVYIECTKWTIKPDYVDGRPCDRLLLLDARMIASKRHRIEYPIQIDHIWTVVDTDWKYCVCEQSADRLYLKGFLYLYGHNGVKNIGFQTLYAKAFRK